MGFIVDDQPAQADLRREALPQPDKARKIFRAMLRARLLESKLSSLYKAGQIVGGVYLGKGQEAVSASLGANLHYGKDIFSPLIRDQAGRTAMGEEMLDCTRTYLGSARGPMRARDGNVHRGRPKEGVLAMISHLGSSVSVVAGMLMGRRMRGEIDGCLGAACVGDGATSTGAFHEGLNMVAVERLPMVVVVTDNQFAYSTPTKKQYACGDLLHRAVGYGLRGHEVDGTSLMECASVIGQACNLARAGKGPQLVVAKLLRLTGHGEHDDASYVPEDLKQSRLGRDCIEVAKVELLNAGYLTMEEYEVWHKEATDEVQLAVATAQKEKGPDPYQEDWSALSNRRFKDL